MRRTDWRASAERPEEPADSTSFAEDLALARGRDREALDRLLARVHARLSSLTERKLGPRLRAKLRTSDILQSTYLAVVRGIESFAGDSEEAFVAWVAQILENGVRRKGRFFQAKKRASEEVPDSDRYFECAASRVPSPSAKLKQSEDLLVVSRALERLPEEYRRVIVLKTVDNRSHEEIGVLIGRTEAATRMLLSRARAALSLQIERLEAASAEE